MTRDEKLKEVGEIWGPESLHVFLINYLFNNWWEHKGGFWPGRAFRKLSELPKPLVTNREEFISALFWFAISPYGVLSLFFEYASEDGKTYEMDGSALFATVERSFIDPGTKQPVESEIANARLRPFFRVRPGYEEFFAGSPSSREALGGDER